MRSCTLLARSSPSRWTTTRLALDAAARLAHLAFDAHTRLAYLALEAVAGGVAATLELAQLRVCL